ncbi:VOC family protein [Variovorax dokdonensis]|uniref:VOC family protein n=1 Tax=Variovorax dokdonensis TaxID=344883 RepID=A0ABT7NDW4_9BURK|nr:VOC family protein [Variovorax dokdonensis]MDM0046136.1 VOC family protein [Variovorax dokdonensis]
MTLKSIELKAFVPAQDFELSKRFYREIGFTMASEGGGIAYFHHQGSCPFLLQSYYVKEFAENLQLHLLVEDVQAWWSHLKAIDITGRYGVRMTDPVEQPWVMIDFSLTDPCGVCWRIGQNIPRKDATP